MHASRHHRSPGNGFRSNYMGTDLATSRISPDVPSRGYSLGYRNFSRSLGRGLAKSNHQSIQSSRRDVFMEAGRLAAEYLVSQGLLPASALSSTTKKKHVGDFQEFKSKEGSGLHRAPEGGRMSALARLGNVVPDDVPSRRRSADEYSSAGSRSQGKSRRKLRLSGSHGSSSSRASGRDRSSSDKTCPPLDMERDFDNAPAFDDDQKVRSNIGGELGRSASLQSETGGKGDDACDLGSKSGIDQLPVMMDSVASGVDKDLSMMDDAVGTSNSGIGEAKEGTNTVTDGAEKQFSTGGMHPQHSAIEGDHEAEKSFNLQELCRFVDMPKRIRSSLMHKKASIPISGLVIIPDASTPEASIVSIENDSLDRCSGDVVSNPESDICKTLSVEPAECTGEPEHLSSAEKNKCTSSHSFPDESSLYNKEEVQQPPAFDKCSSMVMGKGVGKGEEQDALHNDASDKTIKQREWLSSVVVLDDENETFSDSRLKEPISQNESTLQGDEVVDVSNHNALVDVAHFSVGNDDRPCVEYTEVKQCFPGSFDLNLMEASDMNENRGSDSILMYPSISETKKECLIDISLSMSNGCTISDERIRHAADDQGVEVIDFQNGSIPDDRTFCNSVKKAENAFTSLDGFPSNLPSSNDINDVQDGIGFMDLFRNDIAGSSSVSADMNSLHHEGILGDDYSIFLSLEEMPISFLPGWEQPAQDYGKPF